MARVKFGVGMGRNLSIAEIPKHAKAAEDCTFEESTFIDSQNLSRDVYVMMAVAAQSTYRLRIGHGVTNPYTRHPVVTANATGTINELSGGRAFMGVGPGFSSTGTLGLEPRPLADLRRSVITMRALSRGEEIEWDSKPIRSEWMEGGYPILIGSDGPKSLALSGEIADGTYITGVEPTLVKWRLEQVEKGAERAGRDLKREGFKTWIRTSCFLADSKEEARRGLESYAATCAHQFYLSVLRWDNAEANAIKAQLPSDLLEDIYAVAKIFDMYEHEKIGGLNGKAISDRAIDAFMLCGTPDDVAEQIGALTDMGVDRVSITLYNLRDKIGLMEAFRDSVMPHFR